jgi:hypothetical protein
MLVLVTAENEKLVDCRIGADTDPGAYLGNYSWVRRPAGNRYACPAPACARRGVCNITTGCAARPYARERQRPGLLSHLLRLAPPHPS